MLRPSSNPTRAVVLLLLSLLVAPLSGAGFSQKSVGDEITERLQLAQKLQQQGESIRAVSELRQALGLTLEQLGLIHDTLGNLDRAVLAYTGSIEAKSDSDKSLLGLGIAYLKKREFNKGIETVQLLLAQKPFFAPARHLLGKLYFAQGRFDAAVSELEEASRLTPNDLSVAGTLAIVFLRQKRPENAKKLFKRMSDAIGESAQLHVFFGALYRQTDFVEDATEEFKRAISLDPRYPHAHYYLGLSYLSQEGRNKSAEATVEFQTELARDQNDYLSNYLLGLVYLNERKLDQAVIHLERASRIEPLKPDAPLYLGQALFLLGDEVKAINSLKEAIRLTSDPSRNEYQISKAHYLLSQALRRQGNLQEATVQADLAGKYKSNAAKTDVERIQSFLKSGPEDINGAEGASGAIAIVDAKLPDEKERVRLQGVEKIYARTAGGVYNQLGLFSASQNDFKRAAKYFDQASKWYADLPDLDYNLGLAQFKAAQFRQAVVPLERTLEKQPNRVPVRVLLGLSYFGADDYAHAVQHLGTLADSGIDDPQVMFAFGLSLAGTGQRDRGRQILSSLLQRYPRVAEIHLAMGRLEALDANYSAADSEFAKAIEIDPALSDIHYYTGMSRLKQTRFSEAADEFRKEIQQNPQHARAQYHLGFVLASMGQVDEAVKQYEQTMRLDPLYAEAYYELGKIRLQQGRTADAIELLEKGVQLSPNKSYGYYQLSQAYRKAGKESASEQAMSRYRELKAKERGTSP